MQRRQFLAALSSTLAWQTMRALHVDAPQTAFSRDPFQLGVASGEPASDGVVLWTRLAPDVHAADYGLPAGNVDVRWEIFSDAPLKQLVGKGNVAATPELNHSVHLEVKGLKPGREYFYRFHAGGATSTLGTTKTAPAMDTPADKVRFAVASCQSYESGFYVAHRDMAQQDLDAVVFVGDYIYERHNPNVPCARLHDITDVKTLAEYRHHYAQYKTDADLQACHAAHAWIVTPDDHEVENNWAGDHGTRSNPQELVARRTAAYRAYYENMPLRRLCMPTGSHMQLFRSLPYGPLVNFTVLDTRQFRTPQPCNGRPMVGCEGRFAKDAQLMGMAQEAWFAKTMSASPAQWNVVANQTIIAELKKDTPQGPSFGADIWDGYVEPRKRFLNYLATAKPRNPFIVSGDIHHTCVSDIKADFDRKDSPIVASEVVGTSISSGSDGQMTNAGDALTQAANPHVRYQNHKRGYILCQADGKQMQSELRVCDRVSVPTGTVRTVARFVIDNDKKGIRQES